MYLFSVPHLTKEIYQQCERLAYEQGMARIQPGPNHMYTYISAIFLCDSCDPESRKALKRCHRYQSFRLSYWGWMDFHTALVVLPEEAVKAPTPADTVQRRCSNEPCFISKKEKIVSKGEKFMNAALFLIIGVAVLIVGYIFYGGWLAKKWGVDNSRVTPAHELEDGKDYCPAKAPPC